MRKYLKPNPFIFTIVREPLAHLDSLFRFKDRDERYESWASRLKVMDESPIKWGGRQPLDLGWVTYKIKTRTRTIELQRMYDEGVAIQGWLQDLDEGLDYVFLTEFFDEGLVLLRRKLGLTLEEVSYVRLKVSDNYNWSSPAAPIPTKSEMRRLQQHLEVSQALYDHMSDRFWNEWKAAGSASELAREVAALRRLNAELEAGSGRNPFPELVHLESDGLQNLLREEAAKRGWPEGAVPPSHHDKETVNFRPAFG